LYYCIVVHSPCIFYLKSLNGLIIYSMCPSIPSQSLGGREYTHFFLHSSQFHHYVGRFKRGILKGARRTLNCKWGFLYFSFYIRYSTLLHLPPLIFNVSEDAGIEPRTVATTALAIRRSNHSARSHENVKLYCNQK